ncbi:kinase-like domain-containing protein [Leptodontidium sp. 2 PMI_412]|nr:kinase-like domain-containing protein [Leptodontidium sp. 2 PMI_412]
MIPFQIAQTLTGVKVSYKLTQTIVGGVHRSTVFKAKVVSGSGSLVPGSCVLIKTATKERKKFLKQEYDSHCRLAISSSPFIRKMYDIVGDVEDFDDRSQNHTPCLVFEWMDQTLADIPVKDHLRNDALQRAIFEAGLAGLAALHEENLVHTDIKPENILVSGLENLRPTAKIGDLGLTATDGFNKYQVQPFAMRAPEVWRGYGCSHRSDVWSLAAAVLAWAKPGTLGVAAAIAAKDLLEAKVPDRPDEQYIKVRSLDEELQSVNISAETANLLRCLLTTDPENRPEAADALASPEFQALVLKATGHVRNSPRATT